MRTDKRSDLLGWKGDPTGLRWLVLSLAILAIRCSTTTPNEPPEAEPRTTLDASMQGIDISTHSGTVDWSEVAAQGYAFAFAKATEGVDLEDPDFADHWPAMRSAGLLRGAYHFYVTEDDPDEQADFFISKVTLEPGDLAPVADIELIGHDTQPGLAERFQTFLDRLEAQYGVKPIIYTSPNFWDAHLDDSFGDYPLWVAEYGVDTPRLPAGWSDWDLWQWSENAAVEGVSKGADLNRVSAAGAARAGLIVSR